MFMQDEPIGWDDEPVYATVPWESELRDSKRSSYTLDVFLVKNLFGGE